MARATARKHSKTVEKPRPKLRVVPNTRQWEPEPIMQLESVSTWLVENEKPRAWLAEQLGMSRAAISKLLQGRRACSVWNLKAIAALTKIDPVVLLSECRCREPQGPRG